MIVDLSTSGIACAMIVDLSTSGLPHVSVAVFQASAIWVGSDCPSDMRLVHR